MSTDPHEMRVVKTFGPVVFIFFLCLSLTFGATYLSYRSTRAENAGRFDRSAASIVDALQNRMTVYSKSLVYTRNLFDLKPDISEQEFGKFVQGMNLETDMPGIYTIGYIKRFARAEALRFTRQKGSSLTARSDDDAKFYDIVQYFQAIARTNASSLGMDMRVSAERRTAMDEAIDTGEPVASDMAIPITSVTAPVQYLFLVFVPHYKKGKLVSTVQERRKAFQGMVYGGFRVSNFFTQISGDQKITNGNLVVEVFDGLSVSADKLMYTHGDVAGADLNLQKVADLYSNNHHWTLRITAPQTFSLRFSYFSPFLILFAGFITTISVTVLLVRSQRLAMKLKQDIEKRERTEARLLAKNELVEFTSTVGLKLISEQDVESLMQTVTDRGSDLLEARFGSFFCRAPSGGSEAPLIFAVTGVERRDFLNFKLPQEFFSAKQARILRSDDITRDPVFFHWAPLKLRSFISVPVISKQGEVLGGLFFGHPAPAQFSERHEHILEAIAIQAAVAMENSTLYHQLDAARQEADSANHAKSMFLANISHEMRTPLGIMLGYAEVGLEQTEISETKKSLNVIIKNGRELTQIIGDVLDLSKIEANALQVEQQSVSLPQMLEELQTVWGPRAQMKGLTFQTQLDADVPTTIQTDRTRLKQIIVNLLSNAVKFTAQGRIFLSISIDAPSIVSQRQPLLRFRVEDSGMGISAANQSRLFKSFSQVDSSITRKYGGNGLGLALSRQLALALKGELSLERSSEGQGSVFALRIPNVAPSLTDAIETSAPAVGQSSLSGLKILVVDDSHDNQALIEYILRKAGAEVALAGDGLQAWYKIQDGNFDLVLMDLQMPVLDGYGALEKIRSAGLTVPVVALTAHSLKEERVNALRLGFSAYLTKPIDREAMLRAIKELSSAPANHPAPDLST